MLVGVKTTMAFAILSRTHNHQAKMLCWVKCGPFPGQFEHRTGFVLDQITASSRAVLVVEDAHCSFQKYWHFLHALAAFYRHHLQSRKTTLNRVPLTVWNSKNTAFEAVHSSPSRHRLKLALRSSRNIAASGRTQNAPLSSLGSTSVACHEFWFCWRSTKSAAPTLHRISSILVRLLGIRLTALLTAAPTMSKPFRLQLYGFAQG